MRRACGHEVMGVEGGPPLPADQTHSRLISYIYNFKDKMTNTKKLAEAMVCV